MTQQSLALLTLLRREWGRIFRIWPQTLLPSVVTTTLYIMIFGHVIGGRIGPIQTVSYGAFILPGLVMMSVITNSFQNTVFSLFSAKFQRFIEEMLVSPMHRWMILAGFLLGGILRGLLVGGIVTFVGLCLHPVPIVHPLIMLISMTLAATFFSSLGFLNGLFAKKFDDINLMNTFLLTPLTYLGGVFYSIHFLPWGWKQLSLINPIFYLVNALRFGMLGESDVSPLVALLVLSVSTLCVIGLCWELVKRNIGLRI